MKIIEELEFEVDNEFHKGVCRLIVVDTPDRRLAEAEDGFAEVEIDGKRHRCFIAQAIVQQQDREYKRVNIYLLEKLYGSLIGKNISL